MFLRAPGRFPPPTDNAAFARAYGAFLLDREGAEDMRKCRVTEAQIIGMIKEQEAGMATVDVCRKHGLNPATFYKLKAKTAGWPCPTPGG